jgi:flagellar assembly protein FliH
MSSRAKRLVRTAAVFQYDWAGGETRAGSDTAPLAADAPAALDEPAVDAALLGQHQLRLAALERDAFATGYAQGERAGLEAGNKRAEAMLRRLAQTLEELGALRESMIRQTEHQMVDLALAIARRILRRETTLDGDLIVAMARVALERLGEAASATIRLNPEDYAHTVQRHGEEWAGKKVKVLPDASVSRGGCQVESEFGFVNAGVEAQFDEVMRALIGERAEVHSVRAPAA